MQKSVTERFWGKVKLGAKDDCWPWTASIAGGGYGHFWVGRDRGLIPSHVFALEEKIGRRLLPGMRGLHSCDNRPCCNPSHLFEGTQRDNIADMILKRRGNLQNGAQRGEKNPRAKVTREQVEQIRALAGTMRQADIGEKFGLTQGVISKIIRRDIWRI